MSCSELRNSWKTADDAAAVALATAADKEQAAADAADAAASARTSADNAVEEAATAYAAWVNCVLNPSAE